MNMPKCPYCEYVFDAEETWYGEDTVGKIDKTDCAYSKVTCPADDCRKKFDVETQFDITFISQPIDVD